MIGPLYLGNGAGTNSPATVWWDKNRNVWAGTANGGGDFYLYDHTNNKHIIQSTKAGVNNFNGYAVSAGTATYAQNASGNLQTTINNLNANIPFQHIISITVTPTALGTNYTYTNAVLKGKKVIVAIFYSSVGEVFVTQYAHAHGVINTKNDNQYWGGEVTVSFDSTSGKVTFKVDWIGSSQNISNFSLTDIVY